MNQMSHHLAAVWFADVVGYSALSEEDEATALRVVQAFMTTTRDTVERYGGRVVKFLGDGALAEFPSTDLAVRSARSLVRRFPEDCAAAGLERRTLRVGVHVGDVASTEDGDLFGDGVNVASRIQAEADPDSVWVSEDVRRQLRQRKEFEFEPRGERAMKGIRRPLALFAAEVEETAWTPTPSTETQGGSRPSIVDAASPAQEPASHETSHRRRSLSLLGIGALVALVAVGASTWFLGRDGGGVSEASVAVLPFENLSGEAENEYFSDGITDDILTALSKVGGLKVISRTSTLQYKGTTKPIGEIAGELDVATILEGTVRRSGDQVRITAQLIDARTDEHLWAETYDRELTDVFAIQSEIAAEIADRLHVALSQRETASIRAGETSVPEAYDLVLRARERMRGMGTGEDVPRAHSAIELLRQALELDPGYAQAHATLGLAYAKLVFTENRSWADSAQAASRRAIEIAPELSTGHAVLGLAQYSLGQYGEAFASLRRAIELDPNNVEPRRWTAKMLDDLSRWDEELEVLLPAVRADPGDAGQYRQVADIYDELGLPDLAGTWLAEAERKGVPPAEIHASRAEWAYLSGDLDRAEAEMREVGDPYRYGASNTAAGIELSRGRYDEARRVVETVNRESSFEYAWIITPGYIEWKTGNREEAEALFREGERRSLEVMAEAPERSESYTDMARITSTRGDIDAAVSWMEKAYDHGNRFYRYLRVSPILENVRADPRFERLMRRMEADVAAMRERAPKEKP